MTLEQQFGINVRHWRKVREMSQEELAARAGLHPTYVSGIETGARNPTLRVVGRIAVALEVEAAALLKG
ncbi:MAG: helix-turn-helix transcriptional regulator [Pseudomonadota bacterium]